MSCNFSQLSMPFIIIYFYRTSSKAFAIRCTRDLEWYFLFFHDQTSIHRYYPCEIVAELYSTSKIVLKIACINKATPNHSLSNEKWYCCKKVVKTVFSSYKRILAPLRFTGDRYQWILPSSFIKCIHLQKETPAIHDLIKRQMLYLLSLHSGFLLLGITDSIEIDIQECKYILNRWTIIDVVITASNQSSSKKMEASTS
jgi:hypothetical protein